MSDDPRLISRGGPAGGATADTDPHTKIVFGVSELHPWTVWMTFLVYAVEADGEYSHTEYVADGWGLERPLTVAAAERDGDFRLKANTEAAFVDDLPSYKRIAEALLRGDLDAIADIREAMFSEDRSKQLSLIRDKWRALAGPRGTTKRMREMASYFNCSESTIRRRLDECEFRGLLDPPERERRPPRRAAA